MLTCLWRCAMRDLRRVLCIIFLFGAFSMCRAQNTDTMPSYANACYATVGITKDDLPATFDCTTGTLLKTATNGTAFAPTAANNHINPCDLPAWLTSDGKNHQCYGSTYIQAITIDGTLKGSTARPDFLGALLCRNKDTDAVTAGNFDDVAMIFY